MKPPFLRRFEQVNKELWILLSLFAIALLLNHVVASQQMVLGFYVLPTLGSAYLYGRRHATLTALASVLMVVLLIMYGDAFCAERERMRRAGPGYTRWLEVIGLGRFAAHHRIYDGDAMRAEELAAAGTARHLSRRADDPAALHVEGQYTENHSQRVSVVCRDDRGTMDLEHRS